MFITDDNEFCLVRIKFQFDAVHPILNRNKTLSQLCDPGVEISSQLPSTCECGCHTDAV